NIGSIDIVFGEIDR
ncbi:hypothetical protein K678_16700, partial [Magnetospirillum fulvum MGU-K5]